MKSSSATINVAASAPKINVDNRISLHYYYRISDNILRQAAIFREEKNIIDLYVMLLRFLSLATETIPYHRDFRASLQIDKLSLKKKSLSALTELEALKPTVRQKIDELSRKNVYQSNGLTHPPQRKLLESSKSLPHRSSFSEQTSINRTFGKVPEVYNGYAYQETRNQMPSSANSISLYIPRAKDETLSRHSILGPNGLRGQSQPPTFNVAVRYPTNIDLTPVEFPRENKLLSLEDGVSTKISSSNLEHEKSSLDLNVLPNNNNKPHVTEPDSLISFEEKMETSVQPDIIRQPSPPPVLAEVQDLVPATSPASTIESGHSTDSVVCSESPLELHISSKVMEHFMKMAKSNTDKDLETCGILAGSLKNRKFYVTALIIPKQEGTANSCQATNEEEIFEVQDKRSLFPLGWIHTHPTQSCFMSSIDVHTHYAYQIMLPEAIAIVMAPRDSSRKHGIFRLTTPGGMGVIRNCPQRGFHAHDAPSDGSPIYKQCTDVYINPKLNFDVIDLR
ncbi:AMSH-like ubiquitin thioesterase 1 isoform X2 [Rutidosis leptorrhynchoides]|uniref:AMSH-like ubiquitin thioesterase 1 isoform X2 n=1 Tax=Rutidosis leptorrhynchoides TaxID=125765 RepID=UPI003A992422